MKKIFLGLLILVMVLPALSFAAESDTIEIQINRGDTLTNICEKYIGDATRWREIARLNRLRNPDLIFPGETLRFPVDLLKGLPLDGIVTFVKGQVDLYIKATGVWSEVKLDDRIRQGSRLKTGDQSSVEITFGDGAAILLRQNTSFDLAEAETKTDIFWFYKFFIDIGKSLSKVKKVTGRDSRFQIHTPGLVAGARGTSFRVSVDREASTRCEVLEGSVGIESTGEEVEINEGEGLFARKDAPLSMPRKLIAPPMPLDVKALYRSLPLDLAFEKIAEASFYRILLSKDRSFKDYLKEWSVKPGETVHIMNLEDGTYYLRTSAIDDMGLEGPPSEPKMLKVRVNPLPPFIQTPVDGAHYREKYVEFHWLKVQDAAAYHIQVAEDAEFEIIKADERQLSSLTYRTGELDFKTYYFRAGSLAADVYKGIWSDTLTFTIVPPPPSPPLDPPAVDEDHINIRWRHLGEDVSYHFQMAKEKTFSEIILDRKLDRPEISIEKPKEAGVYYIRTSAIDSEGYEGDFSLSQSFEIKQKFPYAAAGGVLITILGLLLL